MTVRLAFESARFRMLDIPRPILPVLAILALWLAAPHAAAQAPTSGAASSTSAVVLQTGSTRDLRELAQATGRLIRVEVDRSGVVQTQGTPALYLEDLQMALGCLGETPECLTVVAQELNVVRLVYATLTRSGARLLLTLVYFDGADVRLVTRGVEAPAPDAAILDVVPAMVREVFGLVPLAMDPRAVAEAETEPTRTTDVAPLAEPSEGTASRDPHGVRMGAYISGGVAVASLAAGAILLARRQSAEEEYRTTPTDTAAGVDDALAARDRGLRLGNAAVGVLAVGGAAAVTSVLLAVLTRKRAGSTDEPPPVSASVVVGPGVVGLHVRGSL